MAETHLGALHPCHHATAPQSVSLALLPRAHRHRRRSPRRRALPSLGRAAQASRRCVRQAHPHGRRADHLPHCCGRGRRCRRYAQARPGGPESNPLLRGCLHPGAAPGHGDRRSRWARPRDARRPTHPRPQGGRPYAAPSTHPGAAGFLLNLIPESYAGAFTSGEILQVLLLAILTGLALAALDPAGDAKRRLVDLTHSLSHLFFRIVSLIMQAAPIGAFAAMAFTVGRYGLITLLSLGKLLLCVYLTSISFVAVVLGLICWFAGVSLWRLLLYLREELLLVLGTSSSEPALPGLLRKMERLGCSEAVTGLVIPAGYSFNLDGTSIYLTIAALFLAQATDTHLSGGQQLFIILVLMLNSKGAAAVTGGGFITLAATLAALGTIPVAGITLLLGVDRFMSEVRALTNLVGNAVATIVIARWEGQFDAARANAVLHSTSLAPRSGLEAQTSLDLE